jgi:hypothetical protein
LRQEKDGRLPSFIGVGPGRTATTWLHAALQGHAGLPRRTKETDFFSNNYSLGFDWYLYHFQGYPRSMILGEITPTYFDCQEASARIARDLPGCKIVCSLRDPVARIYSHYRLLRSEGWISRQTFLEALEHHNKWKERAGNLFGASNYALHLERWFRELGRRNVLVTFVEDLEKGPQQYLDHITDFIDTPRIALESTGVTNQHINSCDRAPLHPHLAARARRLRDAMERKHLYRTISFLGPFFRYCSGRGELFPPLDPKTEQMLRERFRPEVQALEGLLKRDLSEWRPATSSQPPHPGLTRRALPKPDSPVECRVKSQIRERGRR